MCLAIPGKLLDCQEHGGFRTGRVQFGGIVRPVCLDFVPEAQPGDFVMVHVGFAISVVNRKEAERTYQVLQAMGVLEEELQLTETERRRLASFDSEPAVELDTPVDGSKAATSKGERS
jgi:hydrogenase expression/formation protein HypC